MFAILARLFGRRPARPAAPPPYPPLVAWDDWCSPPSPDALARPFILRPATSAGMDRLTPGAARRGVLAAA
ncbi:MAG: hypothetical protein U0871_23845 [Gemmataceae bacterium]